MSSSFRAELADGLSLSPVRCISSRAALSKAVSCCADVRRGLLDVAFASGSGRGDEDEFMRALREGFKESISMVFVATLADIVDLQVKAEMSVLIECEGLGLFYRVKR